MKFVQIWKPKMSELQPEQVNSIRNRLLANNSPINASTVIETIREVLPTVAPVTLIENAEQILAQTIGYGPLENLFTQPGVTDVLVNNHKEVWIDQGAGLERTNVAWNSESELREFAARLASSVNRRLDDVNPFVDAQLKNGIRFHAIIPPLSKISTTLSFRIPSAKQFSLTDLVELKTIDKNSLEILKSLIAKRVSIAISGSTGSGKTTILGALLSEVNSDERILVIEDSAELHIDHPHVIQLQTRNPNAEGIGQIELKHLVKQALRMRPDRLVIGEVRGTEVLDFLVALNTGHEGGCVTVHANSTQSVIARFEALGLLAKISKSAIHALLKEAIQVLIHVARTPSGRKITEISVLDVDQNGELKVFLALDLLKQLKHEPGWLKLQKIITQ